MAETVNEHVRHALESTRADTHRLFDLVKKEKDLHQSPGGGFRPLVWHLAHIGVFEAYWILQKAKGDPAPNERYEVIFDPIRIPREESKDLPSREEMSRYLSLVRGRVLDYLDTAKFDDPDSAMLSGGYVFDMVLEHERQHQETITFLMKMLDPSKKALQTNGLSLDEGSMLPSREIYFEAGEFQMGSPGDSFAYDNELPLHTQALAAFTIQSRPVTNGEYAEFITADGYERREFWDDAGWEWRQREQWRMPFHWRGDSGNWEQRGLFEWERMRPDHPVSGVSWYEAEAYARFRGRRLPTEAEWERAASAGSGQERKRRFAWGDQAPTSSRCNYNSLHWGTTPAGSIPGGATPEGLLDMTGNVWEWTSDAFSGFEGFSAYPYPEYSQLWFDGDHRVLKGGSWATRESVLRNSFRNFFRRHFRAGLSGVRLASDV